MHARSAQREARATARRGKVSSGAHPGLDGPRTRRISGPLAAPSASTGGTGAGSVRRTAFLAHPPRLPPASPLPRTTCLRHQDRSWPYSTVLAPEFVSSASSILKPVSHPSRRSSVLDVAAHLKVSPLL